MSKKRTEDRDFKVAESSQGYDHSLELETLTMEDAALIRRAYSVLAAKGAAAENLRALIISGLQSAEDEYNADVGDGDEIGKKLPDLSNFRASVCSDGELSETVFSNRDEERY